MEVPQRPLMKVKSELLTTEREVRNLAKKWASNTHVALDIESNSLKPQVGRMWLISLCSGEEKEPVYIIDCQSVSPKVVSLITSGKTIVAQDAVFEASWLRWHAGLDHTRWYCTQIAEKVLGGGILQPGDASLAAMSWKYHQGFLDKGIRDTFTSTIPGHGYTPQQLAYSALDAKVLLPIMEQQILELKRRDLLKVVELESSVIPFTTDLMEAGFLIDKNKWREWLTSIEDDIKEATSATERSLLPGLRRAVRLYKADNLASLITANEKISKAKRERALQRMTSVCARKTKIKRGETNHPSLSINVGAHDQVLTALRGLGIKIISTDAKKDLSSAGVSDHPAVKAVKRHRKLAKLLSTYGESMLAQVHPATGRLYSSFDQLGADATGRYSSKEPNLQNIPDNSSLRSAFIAPKDHVIMCFDYGQIEVVLAAYMSQDPLLLETLIRGGDVHSVAASNLYNIPLERFSKNGSGDILDEEAKKRRREAKTFVFSTIYGGTASSAASRLGISIEEASKALEKFETTCPVLCQYQKKVGRESVKNGYSITLLGRTRLFYPTEKTQQWELDQMEREAANQPIQGSAADIIKIACRLMREDLRRLRARPVNMVHDELDIEVPVGNINEVREAVTRAMTTAAKELVPDLPVTVDVSIGHSWAGD